ncbi:MAG: hypothetical protein WB564_03830 [Dehalococcoidia bacterium]
MRIAAGTLMIILGMTALGIFVYSIPAHYSLAFNLLMFFSTIFIVTGGVLCLRRKYWIVCLISSLLLPCSVILLWFWIIPHGLGLFFIPGGILPLIFICLRKREWQESSA